VHSAVGIDLGVSKFATLSDGSVFENIKTTKKFERTLRRMNKSLARKTKGSNNWKKAKTKVAKLHYKIKCVRQDYLHKVTTWISQNYSDVYLENLNVSGMMKNRRLSKAVSDVSFYETRRQLEYKSLRVHFVDRFFPSTKLCMSCGQLNDMPLHKRVFKCDCGVPDIDRDLHAAQNILRQGLPKVAQ
jgi:putative transposase